MVDRKSATSTKLNGLAPSAFTIINRSREVNTRRAEFERSLHHGLQQAWPDIAEIFDQLPKPLREALLSSAVSSPPFKTWNTSATEDNPQKKILHQLKTAVEMAHSRAKATTIGILDLGSRVSELKSLIACMNRAQDRMVFLEVQTPVPAGMIKTGETLTQEFQKVLGKINFSDQAFQDLSCNMLVNEFLTFGKAVQAQNGLDIFIGITPARLSYYHNDEAFYNNISYCEGGPVSMVSTFDLRSHAKTANRPFEAAVGKLLVERIMSIYKHSGHDKEPIVCPFSNSISCEDWIESIRHMHFDEQCMEAICKKDKADAAATHKLIKALKRMKGNHL